MKTIKFHTLGCKVNQYDTQSIRERFLSNNFRENTNGKKADFYLINTCTVTSSADRKSKEAILRYAKANPNAKIIVTGCLIEKNTPELLSRVNGISYIIPKKFFLEGISNFCAHTRAFLKIQDGCNNYCSYCKVPLVRGNSRSKNIDKIIEEAKALVKNGFKEIVLTGICLGEYGKDLKIKDGLAKVIGYLEKLEGLSRIRLSSIEAKDVTSSLIKKFASSDKLCKHLHIPIQSGDDKILKIMNRKITHAGYLKLIRNIKKTIPNIAITCDVIAGFPGESEANFANTIKLIQQITPLRTHIFPYSDRPGTRAFAFKEKTSPSVVKNRVLLLKKVSERCSLKYAKRFYAKTMPVLIEGRNRNSTEFWQGYTDNYIKVLVKSKKVLNNRIIPLKLEKIINTQDTYYEHAAGFLCSIPKRGRAKKG